MCPWPQVTSKANAISIDNCVKTGIMFADVICQVEVINSRALQLQCTGYVPTVSVEKTDGVQIYINKAVRSRSLVCVCVLVCVRVLSVTHRKATSDMLVARIRS